MSGDLVAQAGTIIDVTKTALGLFEIWPLNVMIVGGLIAMGISLVRGFIPKKRAR